MVENDIVKNHLDRKWRLNNLYHIQNKQGSKQLFRLNWAQEQLHDNFWNNNVVLKARQLGVTTYVTLSFLDSALFNSNTNCGIIADTEENAKYIFRKIKFAYDNLSTDLKSTIIAKNDSAKELTFSNDSQIRVGVSLRSSTFQKLLISEFGKICCEDIGKAEEILSGSLNTQSADSFCVIESTARGRSGEFYRLCEKARALQEANKPLSPLDFKFHFFSWWKHPEYRLTPDYIIIPQDLQTYFRNLETNEKIYLSPEQKAWYAKKYETQGENMQREFPSTASEAFMTANEGLYYGAEISRCRNEKRICKVTYDENLPVHTAWDLGFNDSTSIWFFQICGQEIHLLEYIEDSGKPLSYYIKLIKSKEYVFGHHLAPHDINTSEYTTGMTRLEVARELGVNFTPVPNLLVIEGIDQVRNNLKKCWFDSEKCELGIKHLESYKRAWDERNGVWKDKPVHNFSSHTADSFRYLILGLHLIDNGRKSSKSDSEALRKYFGL